MEKQCSKCRKVYPISDFRLSKNRLGKEYRLRSCKHCSNARNMENYLTYGKDNWKGRSSEEKLEWNKKNHLRIMLYMAKDRAKNRVKKKHGIYNDELLKTEFAITLSDLEDLWIKQDGKCAVTNITFETVNPKFRIDPFRPSLDRIDSKRGYFPDNIRFTLWIVNQGIGDYGLDVWLEVAKAAVKHSEKEQL